MNDDPLLKEYLGKALTEKHRAKLLLTKFILKINGYKFIGDMGIAMLVIYRSPKNKFLLIKKQE